MAIRRCPYCKAIIDEQDKYCNNCGTQLLFPEDEFVEEEIPGDKIVDEEEAEDEGKEGEKEDEDLDEERELEEELEDEEKLVEEKVDDTEDEAGEGGEGSKEIGKEGAAEEEEKEEEEEEELEGAEEEETEEPKGGPAEDKEEELELDEELEEEEKAEEEGEAEGAREDSRELEASGVDGAEPPAKGTEPTDKGPSEPEAEPGPPAGGGSQETAGDTGEPPEAEAVAGETEEMDVEEARDIEGGEGRREPTGWKFEPPDPEKKYEVSIEQDELVFKTRELEKLTTLVDQGKAELENFLESHPDFGTRETAADTKDGLPPWVSRIRETPATVEPAEETSEEPKPPRREWTTDSGIGVPEKITQAPLPFGDTGSQKIEMTDEEREGVDEETEEVTAEEEKEPRRPASLSMKLRAKLVDWVFVTALWLISLWFTSQVVGVSFFRLIFVSPAPVLAFYAILLVLYFFLFLYFLGETLGDHYFSEED